MDEELKKLEAELAALSLAETSSRLRENIAEQLAQSDRAEKPANLVWLRWALPLAAALVIAIVWPRNFQPQAEIGTNDSQMISNFKPVASQEILYAAHDDGIVQMADGRLARQMRRSYLDKVVWRNPQTNASLTWSVPRDEVRVIPLSFQ